MGIYCLENAHLSIILCAFDELILYFIFDRAFHSKECSRFTFSTFFKFWRENDVILLAPIFCLSVKTSLVNFSKVRCCVNFKIENIIELS